MTLLSRKISFMLIICFVFQSSALWAKTTQETEELLKPNYEKSLALANLMREFEDLGDSGFISSDEAAQGLANNIFEMNATISEIDQALQIRVNSGEIPVDNYIAFNEHKEQMYELAKESENSQLDPREVGMLIGYSAASFKQTGLSYKACKKTTTVAKVMLGVAIVSGALALALSVTEAGIKRRYDRKRASRLRTFENDIQYVEDRVRVLTNEINNLNSEVEIKRDRQETIVNQLAFDESLTPQEKEELRAEYEQLSNDITRIEGEIENLQNDRAYYSSEENRAFEIAQLEAQYEIDIAYYDTQERNKIENIPTKNEWATRLGWGAGAAAVISGVLFIAGC